MRSRTEYKNRIDFAYKTKIKKPLARAIEHELKSPGELTDYLTYLHIISESSWELKNDLKR